MFEETIVGSPREDTYWILVQQFTSVMPLDDFTIIIILESSFKCHANAKSQMIANLFTVVAGDVCLEGP